MSLSVTHSHSHSRTPSKESSASGASYQLILEHVFQKAGTYEIPLSTMYAINCSAGSKPLGVLPAAALPPAQGPQRAPLSQATAQFTSTLIDHITKLPTQPCSLPVPFITTFLRRCFTEELHLVDFPQALTGLDYLKDLETRRRRTIASAFTNLGLGRETVGAPADQTPAMTSSLASWVKTIASSERKVEALYTQLYIGLRRWILVNEMSLPPFNKYNCLAMLNTLYTPSLMLTTQPTASLTPRVMHNQRDGFLKYIAAVEQRGTDVLTNLMQQGKRPFDENGWPAVRDTLDAYLRVANSLIDDCDQVTCIEDIERRQSVSSKRSKSSKADSGISFGSTVSSHRRASASEDIDKESGQTSTTSAEKPAPKINPHNGSPMWQFSRGFSKLERIAAELRKIKTSRQHKTETVLDVSDANKENVVITHVQINGKESKLNTVPLKRPADDYEMSKLLEQEKKRENRGGAMRKLRSLGDLRSSASRTALRNQSHFDADEMLRKRMIWEANAQKEKDLLDRKAQEQEQEERLRVVESETAAKVQYAPGGTSEGIKTNIATITVNVATTG